MPAEPPEDLYLAAATASVRAEGVNDGYIAGTSRDVAFRAAVRVAYAAGRVQSFRDAAEMVENSKPESTNPNFRRAMEAYRAAIAAGLRISAKLTTTEEPA